MGNLLDNYSDGLVAQLDSPVKTPPTLEGDKSKTKAPQADDYEVEALKLHLQTAVQLQQVICTVDALSHSAIIMVKSTTARMKVDVIRASRLFIQVAEAEKQHLNLRLSSALDQHNEFLRHQERERERLLERERERFYQQVRADSDLFCQQP